MESKVLEIVALALRIPNVKIGLNMEVGSISVYAFNSSKDYAYHFESYSGYKGAEDLNSVINDIMKYLKDNNL